MAVFHHIGILFTDNMNSGFTHNFFSPILDSFKKNLEKNGYSVSFINADKMCKDPIRYYDQVINNSIDGVFIVNINHVDPEVQELLDADFPVVTIDYKTPGAVSISSDNATGIRELVTYVNSLGHTNIAFISGDSDSDVAKLRLDTFKLVCDELGIRVSSEYIRECNYRDMRATGRITEELLALPNPPTCIFYPDDYSAIGGINILRYRGMDIPKDISFCGFDGIDIISYFDPKLTTVKQDVYKMGQIAAETMMSLVEAGKNGDGSEIVIPTSIEKGSTVGKIFEDNL